MTNLEKVEKLREKTNVTYEEAKEVLEACNWDMLDAILKLEKDGKIREHTGAAESFEFSADSTENVYEAGSEQSFQNADTPQQIVESYQNHQEEQQKNGKVNRFWSWCRKILKKSIDNKFIVNRHGEQVMEIPILLLAVLLLASVWTILIILVVGLFFGFGYSFAGPDLGKKDINDAMAKANNVADDIKNEFQKEKE